MAVIPTTFPPVQEQAIATFNFTDLASGFGYETINGFDTVNDTTRAYGAGTSTIFGSSGATDSVAFADTSFAKQLDLNFDTSTFNLPRNVKGVAYMNISFGVLAVSAGDCSGYCIVKLFHFDGSTETQLGATQQTTTAFEARTGDRTDRTSALQFTIPNIHFKKGDLLRINVEVWGKVTANTGNVRVFHDPRDRALYEDPEVGIDFASTSKLELHVPFRIDI